MSHQLILPTTVVAEEVISEKQARAEKIARDKAERKGRNKRIRREEKPRNRAAFRFMVFEALDLED